MLDSLKTIMETAKHIQIIVLTSIFLWITPHVFAQFPPPAGQPGSTAIHCDSAIFTDWANNCIVERGYIDISDTSLGLSSFGEDNYGAGKADNIVVSLGDGGVAIFTFSTPISNGNGFDFAIFENSFSDDFLELGVVEVSSNGVDFYKFEATSNTQSTTQVGTFSSVDATKINNLAGKYKAYWGTPFDLNELKNIANLDVNSIKTIRITDVIGSIDPNFATYDSQNNIINDPWPTPFETGGMDLDAIGVINNRENTGVVDIAVEPFVLFPNPAHNFLNIRTTRQIDSIIITSLSGKTVVNTKQTKIDIKNLPAGFYVISIISNDIVFTKKILKY